MTDPWKSARDSYEQIPVPEELQFAVASAVRSGNRRRNRRRAAHRGLTAALASCACFVLLVNASPTFAQAVSQVPVLGSLARVFTVKEYTVEDREHLIDVRLPALDLEGDTDLEQRINTEIQTRIDQVLQEAEDRARETKAAFVETGGDPDEFMPIIISVDYEIKCQNDQYLSFVLTKTETLASAYTEYYAYNIDLQAGKELTLRDVLGPDYIELANAAVRAGIAQRSLDEDNVYFESGEGGFESISEDQTFYLNEAGNAVIVFEKYEIAPGYMGMQEFEVPLPTADNGDSER